MTDPVLPPDTAEVIEPTVLRRRGVDYEVLVDRFHASGLTQKAFCKRENISYHGFKNHYRRSPKFAGRRRPDRASSAFRPVRPSRPSSTATPPPTTSATIRIGSTVVIECPAEIAIETIARLAAEAYR